MVVLGRTDNGVVPGPRLILEPEVESDSGNIWTWELDPTLFEQPAQKSAEPPLVYVPDADACAGTVSVSGVDAGGSETVASYFVEKDGSQILDPDLITSSREGSSQKLTLTCAAQPDAGWQPSLEIQFGGKTDS